MQTSGENVSVRSRIAELKAKLNAGATVNAKPAAAAKTPVSTTTAVVTTTASNERSNEDHVRVEPSVSVSERLAALRKNIKNSNVPESKTTKSASPFRTPGLAGKSQSAHIPSPSYGYSSVAATNNNRHIKDSISWSSEGGGRSETEKGKEKGTGSRSSPTSIQERIMMLHQKSKSESNVDLTRTCEVGSLPRREGGSVDDDSGADEGDEGEINSERRRRKSSMQSECSASGKRESQNLSHMSLTRPRLMRARRRPKSSALSTQSLLSGGSADAVALLQLQADAQANAKAAAKATAKANVQETIVEAGSQGSNDKIDSNADDTSTDEKEKAVEEEENSEEESEESVEESEESDEESEESEESEEDSESSSEDEYESCSS